MRILLLVFGLLTVTQMGFSQTIQKSTTGSVGGNSIESSQGFVVQQSIGQASIIGLAKNENRLATQGFLHGARLIRFHSDELSINAWPNPFTDHVYVTVEDVHENVEITLHDLSGKEIHRESKNQPTIYLTLPELTTGLYLLTVRVGDQVQTKKLERL